MAHDSAAMPLKDIPAPAPAPPLHRRIVRAIRTYVCSVKKGPTEDEKEHMREW